MIELLHFYISSFTFIMSYCIAFNENFFILCLVQTCSFFRRGSLNVQYTLDENFWIKFLLWKILFNTSNLNRDVILSICVRAVLGITNRNKVFPQTLPNKWSLVASKYNHFSLSKYVTINFWASIGNSAKGPFLTSCNIENFKSWKARSTYHTAFSKKNILYS